VVADPSAGEPVIEIARDRRTAVGRLACTVRTAAPIEAPGCTLLDMARLQGEGVVRRTEAGVLEQSFVRRGGVWRIARSELRLRSQAPQA
jgi:hypothetical protein